WWGGGFAAVSAGARATGGGGWGRALNCSGRSAGPARDAITVRWEAAPLSGFASPRGRSKRSPLTGSRSPRCEHAVRRAIPTSASPSRLIVPDQTLVRAVSTRQGKSRGALAHSFTGEARFPAGACRVALA